MSILPDVPSRGPAATAVMIGEKVADMMKAEAASEELQRQAVKA
jgi:choline dehydrogenase